MNILVVNDDGLRAQGILHLAQALSQKADVYVCAPDSQRSACGHGITVRDPIYAKQVAFAGAVMAYELSGTPADCVKLGLKIMQGEGVKIDAVYSGINHGANLGTDVLYSGTVSGAIEGLMNNIPSVAVSVNSHEPGHFELAKELAARCVDYVKNRLSPHTMININVPDLPREQVKGLKVTKLGDREYNEEFEHLLEESGRRAYRYNGTPVFYEGLPSDIDVVAMQDGYATLTPLHYDLTNYKLIQEVEEWGFAL